MALDVSGSVSPEPPKTRWGVVIAGGLACLILLPVMLVYRQNQQMTSEIQPELSGPVDPRRLLYASTELPDLAQINSVFSPIALTLQAKCKDVQQEVEETLRKRSLADPHLAAAIQDPINTPFVGPNPHLPAEFDSDRKRIPELLIQDYEKNTLDDASLKENLIPRMKEALDAAWISKLSKEVTGLAELDSDKADPLFYYCLIKSTKSRELREKFVNRLRASLKQRKSDPLLNLVAQREIMYSDIDLPLEEVIDERMLIVKSLVDFISVHAEDKQLVSLMFRPLRVVTESYNDFIVMDLLKQLYVLRKPSCPEWILQYLAASINGKLAERYRGTTYINYVSPENLAFFEKISESEAKQRLRAWVLAPDQIELYADLIRLEGSAGSTGYSNEIWLRHALATQVDCRQAFEAYTNFCMPRWGGSNEKLIWLAEKASESVGIEADLPFYYWYPLHYWCNENAYLDAMENPKILKATLRIVDYLKSKSEYDIDFRIEGLRAGMIIRILWDAGQLGELNWFLNRFERTIEAKDLNSHSLNLTLIKQVCHAAQGDSLECWQVIHSNLLLDSIHLDQSKLDSISQALEEAASLAEDDKAKQAVATCKKMYAWAKSFHAGEETVLEFEENAPGWFIGTAYEVTNLKSTDGSGPILELTTKTKVNPTCCRSLLRFPTPYALEAKVQCKNRAYDTIGFAMQCGPYAFYASKTSGAEIRIHPLYDSVKFDSLPAHVGEGRGLGALATDIRGFVHTLRLEMRSTEAKAFYKDKEFGTYRSQIDTLGVIQFGRKDQQKFEYIPPDTENITYRILNVKIKRLTDDDVPSQSSSSPFEYLAPTLPSEPSQTPIDLN